MFFLYLAERVRLVLAEVLADTHDNFGAVSPDQRGSNQRLWRRIRILGIIQRNAVLSNDKVFGVINDDESMVVGPLQQILRTSDGIVPAPDRAAGRGE